MKIIGNRSGYTLVEVLVVSGLMVFIAAGAIAVMLSSVRVFDSTTTETFTDSDAVLAMQMMVMDVREAKSVQTFDSNTRLRVTLPVRLDEQWAGGAGYYDCHQADTTHQIDFYLSDKTGQIGKSGDCLWKKQYNKETKMLREGVSNLKFIVDADQNGKVWITVTTKNNTGSTTKQTQLTNRVIYLRNYRNN